jgi:hypothetical protein
MDGSHWAPTAPPVYAAAHRFWHSYSLVIVSSSVVAPLYQPGTWLSYQTWLSVIKSN